MNHPLVELEGGCYCWSLEGNDPLGFWDRFLDGLAEQPDTTRRDRRVAQLWLRQRLSDLTRAGW